MDTLTKLDNLFKRSAQCPAPVFHVADRVLDRLQGQIPLVIPLRPLSLVAGLSAAAAIIAIVMAFRGTIVPGELLADAVNPVLYEVLP